MAPPTALVVGTGVAERIASGLSDRFTMVDPSDSQPLNLAVWAEYSVAATRPRPLIELTASEWDEACDRPLRAAIDFARTTHPRLAAGRGTIVFLVPLMASAGGAGYTPLATVGEGVRILAKSLAKTWGGDGVTAHAITLDPHAFLEPDLAAGIAEANSLHDPPFGRIPDDRTEVAPIIEWLASATAAPLTGASLVVDGGLWMPG